MCPTAEAVIQLSLSPCLVIQDYRDPVVSKVREEWGSRVIQQMDVFGKVGTTPRLRGEGLPTGG